MKTKKCRRCGDPCQDWIPVTVEGESKQNYLCDRCDQEIMWEKEDGIE